jgi:acetylornithine deacetylase/succinyl-diaminopimelate desuccinylase-like protein
LTTDVALHHLQEFCRIPSVSTSPSEVARAASWLVEHYGNAADRVETFDAADGTPIGLLLEFDGDEEPGITFYNYFDVTPPGDESAWIAPPFDAEIHADRLYARGAAGNKADLIARLEAVAGARTARGLRRRVAVWLDGQEELGALTVPAMLDRWEERLAAPLIVWNTGFVNDGGAPIVSLGFKGIIVGTVSASNHGFASHSGVGLGTSAVRSLLDALATLQSRDGRAGLESFQLVADVPFPADSRDLELGLGTELFEPLVQAALAGAFGVDLQDARPEDIVRRALFEPTINVPWIEGGSPDELTRYAATAQCALEVRLVPPQDTRRMAADLERYFRARELTYDVRFALDPYVVDTERRSEVMTILSQPVAAAFGAEPRVLPIAPSGAPAAEVAARLGSPVVGVGLTDSRAHPHGTNESVSCEYFARSLDAMRRLVSR